MGNQGQDLPLKEGRERGEVHLAIPFCTTALLKGFSFWSEKILVLQPLPVAAPDAAVHDTETEDDAVAVWEGNELHTLHFA